MNELKKKTAVFLAAVLLFNQTFVLGNWAAPYFETLSKKQIIIGDEKGYREDDPLLRCEFAAMLSRAFSFSAEDAPHMRDVHKSDWYYNDFAALCSAGILTGDENGNMLPNSKITRAEMAVMLARALSYPADYKVSENEEDVPSYAVQAVRALKEAGVLAGYPNGTFGGNRFLLRAEAAAALTKALDKIGFTAGDGTKENPYVITESRQIALINRNLSANYVLNADLNLSEEKLPVIGTENQGFSGSFNGKGHKIIAYESTEGANIFFRKIEKSGTVQNVRLVCPKERFSLASVNEGKILGCSNTSYVGEITDYMRKYGGIAQINRGTISFCYNASAVQKKETDYTSGGITAENFGTVKNSFNIGTVGIGCGGIAGDNAGTVENCYTTSGRAFVSDKGQTKNIYSGSTPAGNFAASGFTQKENLMVFVDFPFYNNEDFVLFAGGDGSAQNPYRVQTAEQFANIKKKADKHFLQEKDIENPTALATFSGVYDGGGYKIINLRINKNEGTAALFEQNSGVLQNIHLKDAWVTGTDSAALLAGENLGVISFCSASGRAVGKNAGGICCYNALSGTVEESYGQGAVQANAFAGGIAAVNNGGMINCYDTSLVLGASVGGLAGENRGEILTSYFAGSVKDEAGGAVFSNFGSMSGVYANADRLFNQNFGQIESSGIRNGRQMEFMNGFPLFDFSGVWALSSGKYSYPVLKRNPHILQNAVQNVTDFSGGSGTLNDPYRIVTPNQFEHVNDYPNANFVLMNDLYLDDSFSGITEPFYGFFDGNGKSINGYAAKNENSALFYENNGTITGLNLADGRVSGKNSAGIVYKNSGTVSNCSFEGKISASGAAIAFENSGLIEKCASGGTAQADLAAGIALKNSGEISNCYSVLNIEAREGYGIANGGTVSNSWYGGYFAAKSGNLIASGTVQSSYFLNFYGLKASEAKTTPALSEAFYQKDGWEEKGGLPVLAGIAVPKMPIFDLSGDGTTENPYIIINPEQLKFLGMYSDNFFRLDRNVYLNESFRTISEFSGGLDGNGHKINGLKLFGETAGLFGTLSGNVQQLTLENITAEGSAETGSIAGINKGTIENCTVLSSRIGTSGESAGGIAGENKGSGLIFGCRSEADVFSSARSGGIAGKNNGTVTECSNAGGIIATGEEKDAYAGGIAGENDSVLDSCYNAGKILSYSESGNAYAGGVSGGNLGSVLNSYNLGEINAKAQKGAFSGGICGYSANNSEIQAAYNTGFTNASASTSAIGSAAGTADGGRLRAFVYDHTLPQPVGSGSMSENKVVSRSADVMMRKEGFDGFNFDTVWCFDYDGTYYFPQLAKNRQVDAGQSENITEFAGGDGSMDNPYKIITPDQLNNVRKHLGATFMLLGDIDMTSYCKTHEFLPIGDNVFSFFGLFVGNNYKISGLSFAGDTFGLFRQNHGEIYNCMFENAAGSGTGGTVAAVNTGLIYNCANFSDLHAESDFNINRGGLVGVNGSTGMIISSFNVGDLSVYGENVQAGGIAYGNFGIISGSFNSGIIASNAEALAVSGGIAGYNFGVISDCYTSNSLSAESKSKTESLSGGISGTNGGSIVNCYYSGVDAISAQKWGGIAATNTGAMTNCYYSASRGYFSSMGAAKQVKMCTRAQLEDKSTFEGFDFENMWIIDSSFKYKCPQFIEIAHRQKGF